MNRSGLTIDMRLYISLGLAKAGVPVNSMIRFRELKNGVKISDLLLPLFFK